MSAYSDKLKDPRWQKKRLDVLERAGWKCECCGDDKETLQVHHLIYSKGEPWDAPDETLECLCEPCHEWREDFNDFCEGRTMVPTVLIFAFCRAAGNVFKPGLLLPSGKQPGDGNQFFLKFTCLGKLIEIEMRNLKAAESNINPRAEGTDL